MSEQRRQALEALLATDAEQQPGASRMSLLCGRCVSELGVSGAGATVLTHLSDGDGDGDGQATRRGLVHASNDVSAGLEDLQLTVGEGPCLDTFTTGGPVLVDDLAQAHQRWPAFAEQAHTLGAAAVFSFPLQVGVIRLGSLDCYRDATGPLGQAAITDALILADLATHTIMTELDGHATDDVSWLADPHAEIHQASGMVRIQLGSSTEAALLRMRAHAYTHELALTDVARHIVARELRFSADTDPDPLS
ncbi:hypothetical protein GIY23_10945 [Allosaccharopolyspora coralli]|uniref:ANTAR domain-containing protein n=1 Tax=Allosaccharopolyspora coralli TaxID=2665642 RepID=A0A5Q3Q830_9PSEU|nr:GAF and ANTAR domain-containing protein [Allosaccharopolyspora coralli]QGK68734.1 hypothetical protein GIY23_03460 [Allosaccharopolyspora coralli]QGK69970.1 hypothetical protein GIY23_10945 [Allosaccharopolyspora coralli]